MAEITKEQWNEVWRLQHPEPEQGNPPQKPQTPQQGKTEPGAEQAQAITTPEQMYGDLTAKYGEKTGQKVKATVADREKTLAEAKKKLDKAQKNYDEAPIGKEDKAEADLQKAQTDYDNALADRDYWNKVKAEYDKENIVATATPTNTQLQQPKSVATPSQQAELQTTTQSQPQTQSQPIANTQTETKSISRQSRQTPRKEKTTKKKKTEPKLLREARNRYKDMDWAQTMLDTVTETLEPANLEEVAAYMLSHPNTSRGTRLMPTDEIVGGDADSNNGRVVKGFDTAMGTNRNDRKGYPFIFAKREKGGLSFEQFGEAVESMARELGVLFDETDAMAGYNAAQAMFGAVITQGDIDNYILHNRLDDVEAQIDNMIDEGEYREMMELGMDEYEYEEYKAWREDEKAQQEYFKNLQDYLDFVEKNVIFAEDEEINENQQLSNNERYTETTSGRGNEENVTENEGSDTSTSDVELPQLQGGETNTESGTLAAAGVVGQNSVSGGESAGNVVGRSTDTSRTTDHRGEVAPKTNVTFGFDTYSPLGREILPLIKKWQDIYGNIINRRRGFAKQNDKVKSLGENKGWNQYGDVDLYAVFDSDGNFIDFADSPRGAYDIALGSDVESFYVVRQQPTEDGYQYNGTTGWLFTDDIPEKEWRDTEGRLREDVKTAATKSIADALPTVLQPRSTDTAVAEAERETDTTPTEAQKEAGNYKKGHVKIDGYDISIEQPKGSVRSGTDENGNPWSVTMNNTYGYIRGTEGVDGDHIDVFLSDNLDDWNGIVYVVDQVNPDDGSFDEHKVMYGFNSKDEAASAYNSNYSEGWQGLGAITPVSKEEFKKWIDSSHRKTKPFAEYVSVKPLDEEDTLPTPKGRGVFGNIYDQFRGKVKEAFDFLIKHKEGDLLGVFHDNELGDIDLVWGSKDENKGLEHIIDKHVGEGKDFATVDEAMRVIEDVINNGSKIKDKWDKVTFDLDGRRVVVRKNVRDDKGNLTDEKKNWVVTSFDNNIPKSKKKSETSTIATPESITKAGLSPSTDISDGKDTKNSATDQKNVANSTESEQKNYTISPVQYTTKRGKVLDMHLVTFDKQLSKDELRAGKEMARETKGWYDKERGGFMMRNEESARQLAETLSKGDEQAIADAQPLSAADIVEANNNAIEEENATKEQTQAEQHSAEYKMFEADAYKIQKQSFFDSVRFITKSETKTEQEKINDYIAELDKLISIYTKDLKSRSERKRAFAEGSLRAFNELKKEIQERKEHNSQSATEQPQSQAEQEQPEQEEPKAKSQWVNDEDAERFEELRQRLRKKLGGQLNMGLDPEAFSIGVEMSYLMLKHGARKFKDFAKNMIEALGESIRPYLKSLYNGARDLPEMAEYEKEMTPYDEVRSFDVENFDKQGAKDIIKTAETIVREQEVEKEVETTAKDKLKDKRNNNRKETLSNTQQGQLDLFGSSEAETQQNNNTDERLDIQTRSDEGGRKGHQQEPDGTLGRGTRNEAERPDGRGVGGRDTAHTGSDTTRGGGISDVPQRGERIDGKSPKKNINNNHAERGVDYAPKSVDARIEANLAAIELSQKLIDEGRPATEKEKEILRKYSGWGGLGKAFRERVEYGENGYDSRLRADYQPANPYNERLRKLLSPEAYEQAEMSRNSAFFTPAKVIDSLWDIAKAMGFKGGKVLEGSAGIGNIIGAMPADMSERSDIRAVEIDQTTGNILKLLYPDAEVEIQGFEATRVPNASVDLCITNVPFVTGLRVNDTSGDKDLSRRFHDIHDFCIAKNVRKLRQGGIGIFITSSGTLDNSQKLRNWLVSEGNADVVGVFRLNNETFGGTGVTSDIIVVRKRVNGQKSANAIDVSQIAGVRTAEYKTGKYKKVKGEEVPEIKNIGMDYNKYFVEHPEMMGGEMQFGFENGNTYRAESKGLYPAKGINQDERLAQFVRRFSDMQEENSVADVEQPIEEENKVYEELGEGVKEGSMLIDKNGNICIASYGRAVPLDINNNKVRGHSKQECFKSYTAIKEALEDVLKYQTENEDNAGLQLLLDKLNKAFDDFTNTYGHFHKNTSIAFLRKDMDFSSIAALESAKEYNDKNGNRQMSFTKSDVFRKRVVEKEKEPQPKNVNDGVITSIFKFGRIDIPYISNALGESENKVKNEIISKGLGFENPLSREVEVSYEYLSGNVREKLQQAIDANENGQYNNNIEALHKVIPMDIPAHLIEFTIGSSWPNPQLYIDYIKERTGIDVKLANIDGTWIMTAPYYVATEQNRAMGVRSDICDKTIFGHQLIEAALQNKTISVSKVRKNYETNSTETITDKEATSACNAKINEIRDDFKDWARDKMQNNPALSEEIERVYNERFNNFVPKSIPDNFLPEHFPGSSKDIKLRPHQAKSAIRATTQPLMLAHEVGTGKTFTLITTAMEMRRLGTARKPMIVVQNATVGQFVASAKTLYPNAKVLTLEDADRTKEGRKAFYAKIKYNDWDMIVIPQSAFDMIPDSIERQIAYIEDKIAEKLYVLEQMKNADVDENVIKEAEKELDNLQDELSGVLMSGNNGEETEKQNDGNKKAVAIQNATVRAEEALDRRVDDVEDFDKMGIDAILIDEAHAYKHLGFATAMQRGVKGIDPSYSKKAQGVYLKAQSVKERTGGKNVVFATGTPISNTAAEIWTFMRYLMPDETMKEYGIYHFDDFVRNFGNLSQMLEFATNGKFKENNRFAGYVNLPELVRLWAGVSDTVLTDEASDLKDKIPEMEGGKAQDIYLPQTPALRSVMKFVKAQLEEFENMTPKEKKKNRHIPLTMYGIAKAAAVDVRLVINEAPDEPNSKTNEAVRQTLRSLKDTESYKGTVAIFADTYQNKISGFNLYEDIRQKLIEHGVPAEQIVVMKSGMSINKKLEIFDKVNAGEIRVILGSTATLGTGVNIQERLHTLIHLDAPNRPMDYTQRNGRILRQGNIHKEMNKPVRILRFGVEDSLDVTAYQRLKTKGAIADSIMHGKQLMSDSMENRTMEEEEDVFGDTVAQLSGSEYAMLKQQAEREVRKFEAKKRQYEADQTYIHNKKPKLISLNHTFREKIDQNTRNLQLLEQRAKTTPQGITIGKQKFADRAAMADFLKEYNKKINTEAERIRKSIMDEKVKDDVTININGFDFVFTTKLDKEVVRDGAGLRTVVHRNATYSCEELGLEDETIPNGYIANGIDDVIETKLTGHDFNANKKYYANRIAENEEQIAQMEKREGKPFEFAKELEAAQARYKEYEEKMREELAEKEAKYAEMDAEVETATDVLSVEDDEENSVDSREGDAVRPEAMTYEERLAMARRMGYSKKQFDEYNRRTAARAERRARERVADMVQKLNIADRTTVADTVDDVPGLTNEQRKARANKKGWYDRETGKIVIILNNHDSVDDIIKTVIHEGVGHFGLRKLFGRQFDNFLDNVYANADPSVRKQISDLAKSHHGWDYRKATEEYLSRLAENETQWEYQPTEDSLMDAYSWWQKIKDLFWDMLHKLGIAGHKFKEMLTDNELRYILWRSYKNLTDPSRYRSVVDEAEDVVMQEKLKVGQFEDAGVDFRDEDEETTPEQALNDGSMNTYEKLALIRTQMAQANKDSRQMRDQALKALDASLTSIRKAQQAATQPTKTPRAATPTSVKLRKLQPGETCHVERRYEENKMFSFTGKEKIESQDDVAFIFKQLETAAVENTFVVFVKNGKPTIFHIGMGAYTAAQAPLETIVAAFNKMKPDTVTFVHNHPSGALKASREDVSLYQKFKTMFGDKVRDGIIIDTTSGQYGTFDDSSSATNNSMPQSQEGTVPLKIYSFSNQVFDKNWNPQTAFAVHDSMDIATFISSHRLGDHPKMGLLVLDNQNRVTGNFFLPWTSISEMKQDATLQISNLTNLAGGNHGVLFGNYKYTRSEDAKLRYFIDELKQWGTPLLDILHVEPSYYHSAYDTGVMEQGKEYGKAENGIIISDIKAENSYAIGKKFVSLQFERDKTAVENQRTNMPHTAIWQGEEDVIVHTTLRNIKEKYGDLHHKAKSGNVEAADELVEKVVKYDKVKALSERYPNARVAFVHADELNGRNQIPSQYALVFEDYGLKLTPVIQINHPEHTGADKAGRLIRRARFDGDVENGAEYIIVDDHVTMGSTLRDLKDYIVSKGGKVVAVSTLTASAGSTKLRPTGEQIKELNNKGITNEQLRDLGIADNIAGLTRSEAEELLVLANARGNSGTQRRRTAVSDARPGIKEKAQRDNALNTPAYRDEDTTPPDPWLSTYEESLASARRFGYTKKQHDAFIERSRRYTRKFIAAATPKACSKKKAGRIVQPFTLK